MGHNFLTFQIDEQKRITFRSVVKADLIPWTIGFGFAFLLYFGVSALLKSVRPDMSNLDVSAILYTWGEYFLWGLIVLALLIARRSKDAWTWVLAVILIFIFLPQTEMTLAIDILPNSILQPMVAMIGLLSLGRIIEYLHMRYSIGLDEPSLTIGTIASYAILILIAIMFCSHLIYELI